MKTKYITTVVISVLIVSIIFAGIIFNTPIDVKSEKVSVLSSYQRCVDNGNLVEYIQPQYAQYSNLNSYYCAPLKEPDNGEQ